MRVANRIVEYPIPRRSNGFPLAVAASALLLRVVWVLTTSGQPNVGKYITLAQKLAHVAWAPKVAFTSSPLYTILVAALNVHLGIGVEELRLLQAVVGACTVLVVWRLAALLGGRSAANIAGAIVAAYPAIILYDTEHTTLVWENLFNACALLCLVLLHRRRMLRYAMGAGVAIGCSALLRPNMLLILPLVVPFIFFVAGRGIAAPWSWGLSAVFVFSVALTICPVAVMNSRADGGLILVTASGGSTLYGSNNCAADGQLFQPPEGNIHMQLTMDDASMEQPITVEHLAFRTMAGWVVGRTLSAREASAFWRREALIFMGDQPLKFLALIGAKARFFFSSYESHDLGSILSRGRPLGPAMNAAFLLVWPAGIVGVALSRKRWKRCLPLYFLMAVVLATGLIFYVNSRLRLPVVLPLAVLAGLSFHRLAHAIRVRSKPFLIRFGVAVFCIAALLAWPSSLVHGSRSATSAMFDHFMPAWSDLNNGRTQRAFAGLERAAVLNPTFANLALPILRNLPGNSRSVSLEEKLEALARGARDLSGDDVRHWDALLRGDALYREGDFQGAMDQLDISIRYDPRSCNAYHLRALSKMRLHRWSGAMTDLEQAFDLGMKFRRNLDHYYYCMAFCALNAHRPDKAIRYAQRATLVNPEHTDALRLSAQILSTW